MSIVGYLVWLMFEPFISALALSAIIVTICYPLYGRVLQLTKHNRTVAALLTTFIVLIIVILPVIWITSLLFNEALNAYRMLGTGQLSVIAFTDSLSQFIQNYIPAFDLNLSQYIQQGAQWLASKVGVIFTGTATTIFSFFIALIGSFYFFRDGSSFTKTLIKISPLPDDQDELILKRTATAVRSVATGTVFIALIQGLLTAIGMTIVGFEQAVLFGVVAAFGALIPGIGTTIVFVPAILYLVYTSNYGMAGLLLTWGVLAVGLIDNLLGPYIISKQGTTIHPFLILLAVLGGVGLFGPIGFVVGPVIISLFIVLLELYSQHIAVS